jgi:hypothetical protein
MIEVRSFARLCAGVLAALAVTASAFEMSALATSARAQSLSMGVTLTPKRLGHGTSIGLTVRIRARAGGLPAPIRRLDLLYPENYGIALSGLGTETCTQATLESSGPAGCPADSVMGYGQAQGGVASGTQVAALHAKLTAVRAQNTHGHIALLFDAQGLSPAQPNLVFSGLVLPARRPFDEIHINVPLVRSQPGAGDVALVGLTATIGPAAGLRYTETVHGRTVSYIPAGILMPNGCPRGGFPFAANIGFEGGTSTSARTKVPCPARPKHARSVRS